VRRFLRENGLSISFGALFLGTLGLQSMAGWKDYNEELLAHDDAPITYGRYLYSSEFGAAVMENWQSEYLQFFLFILVTIWLLQKGSNESKELGESGLESDQKQMVGKWAVPRSPLGARASGLLYHLYANSLLLAMGVIFLASWFAESVTSWTVFNAEQVDHQQPTIGWGKYLTTPRFLGEEPSELAVRVPGGRHDGRLHDLSAPARLARVKAGRRAARRDGDLRIADGLGGYAPRLLKGPICTGRRSVMCSTWSVVWRRPNSSASSASSSRRRAWQSSLEPTST